MALLFEKGSKVVCIGDSITDFERARPYGEGLFGGIGKSYVGIVDGILKATDPSLHLRMINMGIGGNTSRDLVARWQTDVMDLSPDYVTPCSSVLMMFGANLIRRKSQRSMCCRRNIGRICCGC